MKIKSKKGIACFIAMLLVLMFSSTTVFASGNITTASYWDDIATQIVNRSGGVADADDLAAKLSLVSGKSQYNDNGSKYTTVIIAAGPTGPYYVAGAQLQTAPDTTRYNAVTLSNFTSNTGVAITDVTVFYYKTADVAALNKINANISSGLLSQSGVTPDTGSALNLLSGVMPMVNMILGLIVVVISVGMTVFSAFDIIYLAFPAFRGKIDTQVEGQGKGTKQNKDGSVSSKWVTDDARLAMTDANNANTQPWGLYFKRRILAYIFLAIILFILLTGNIFAITTLVTDALQGLFSSLGIG